MKYRVQAGKAQFTVLVLFAVALFAVSYARQGATATVKARNSESIKALTDPMTILRGRVDDLEKLAVSQGKALKKSQDEVLALQREVQDLKDANRPPKGYTSMYITRNNFDHVDATALMKFFVRY